MNKELWKSVVGYEEFYEVSDHGRIRSLDRIDSVGGLRKGILREVSVDTYGAGYRYIGLSARGIVKKHNVHILVLQAFVGPRPSPNHQACHEDGDKTNARLDNLRWDTAASNCADKWKHGTQISGEKSPIAVLTQELVQWIRESPQSSLKLAPVLEVASSTIRAVRIGQNWSGKPKAPRPRRLVCPENHRVTVKEVSPDPKSTAWASVNSVFAMGTP